MTMRKGVCSEKDDEVKRGFMNTVDFRFESNQ